MFIAELDTPHFNFRAAGTTDKEARDAMRRGWAKHKRQMGGRASWVWADLEDGVNVYEISAGGSVRDGSPLTMPRR